MTTTREYQAVGSARLELAATIIRRAAPIARREGVPTGQTSRLFAQPPWRVLLQERYGTNRIELFRGRKLMAATWGDGDTGLHVEYLKGGTDWIRDLLRELR